MRSFKAEEFITLLGDVHNNCNMDNNDYCALYDLFMDYILRIDQFRQIGIVLPEKEELPDKHRKMRSDFAKKRKKLNLSFRDLEKVIGMNYSSLHRFETSTYGEPTHGNYVKLKKWIEG